MDIISFESKPCMGGINDPPYYHILQLLQMEDDDNIQQDLISDLSLLELSRTSAREVSLQKQLDTKESQMDSAQSEITSEMKGAREVKCQLRSEVHRIHEDLLLARGAEAESEQESLKSKLFACEDQLENYRNQVKAFEVAKDALRTQISEVSKTRRLY
jgi:chaperonin cofactor prefoldin